VIRYRPQKYRDRPTEVAAVQWTGGNLDEVRAFAGHFPDNPGWYPLGFSSVPPQSGEVYDQLHDIWVPFGLGDWIVRSACNELHPYKPDVFAATYEPVPVEAGVP
jgi:hypothetical protein